MGSRLLREGWGEGEAETAYRDNAAQKRVTCETAMGHRVGSGTTAYLQPGILA